MPLTTRQVLCKAVPRAGRVPWGGDGRRLPIGSGRNKDSYQIIHDPSGDFASDMPLSYLDVGASLMRPVFKSGTVIQDLETGEFFTYDDGCFVGESCTLAADRAHGGMIKKIVND
jgi:hypothetical protein